MVLHMRKSFLASVVSALVFAVGAITFGATPARACHIAEDNPSFLFGRIVQSWTAKYKHPLIGRVYDTRGTEPNPQKAQFKEFCLLSDDFWIMIERPDILLLGEVHDNAEHHRLRASMLQAGAVVSEHVTIDRAPGLARFLEMARTTKRTLTIDDFKELLRWPTSGWSDDVAQLLFTVAMQNKIPIYPGDVPRNTILRISKEGPAAFAENDVARMKLNVPLGEKLDEALLTEIADSHCGAMPKEAFHGMAFAQRFRDANMADMLLKAVEKHGSAVLIAGNGHVRTDRGVPWYLHQRAPDKKVVSVMLIEVEEGGTDPESYVPRDPDDKPAADFLIFTPRAEREDPCKNMRAHMKK